MCQSFLLFYNKNLLFLFYTVNLQKHSHQIIYNTPSFIKIILFHRLFFLIISLTWPHHLTSLVWNTLSLSFSPSSFYLLLSSSTFFFFSIFFLSSSFSFLKKKIFLFLPLSFSIKSMLSSNLKKKKSLYQASMAQYTHSLSHGGGKLEFWVDCILPNGFSVVFYFELILG